MVQAVSRLVVTAKDRVSMPEQYMRDLWYTMWQWDRFFSGYFGFFLSLSLLTYLLHGAESFLRS